MTFLDILLWILSGIDVTLTVAFLTFLVAAPFAFVFGILQYRTTGLIRFCVTSIIEFWRSSSLIILLFAFFYVLPVVGITLQPLTVACMVIGCNIGAHGSQAVRGALAALPAGQLEAALSLGLRRNQSLFLVEIPQAFRTMLPIFGNEIIEIIKVTSNVSLITMVDMTFRAKEVMQFTYRPTETYTALVIAYVTLCGIASLAVTTLIKRIDRVRGQ